MTISKSFLSRSLIIALVSICGLLKAQGNCTEPKATIQIVQATQNKANSVKIDFHGQSITSFQISLVGPKGFFRDHIQEQEIKGLPEGTFTLVLTPVREKDNFCIKHFEFTIKNE